MTAILDRTHDPKARSWFETEATQATDFPIQNLPFGRFAHPRFGTGPRVGVAIGASILDVCSVATACDFKALAAEAALACAGGNLNCLIALSLSHATALRHAIFDCLSENTEETSRAPAKSIVPMEEAELLLPVEIGDYSDFFCSMHHAINASRIFNRPEPLRPNYHYLPVGYHGRASSVVVSGTPVCRPYGELPPEGDMAPVFAPSEKLDYEVELGIILRGGNSVGDRIPVNAAEDAIFGVCLQNDWSARDIQRWENQPLGPFLSKSFATTLSPWVVTVDALRPFLLPMPPRGTGIPQPPAHLLPEPDRHMIWNIDVSCAIETEAMRAAGHDPVQVSLSRYVDMHWSALQMVAHHASNGCNLRAGDLLGSGTMSGPTPDSLGCLLELTHDGAAPITIGQETRAYLRDGDRIVMTGRCETVQAHPIGFGACSGLITTAKP